MTTPTADAAGDVGDPTGEVPGLGSAPLALEYDRLRVELSHLWSAPVRDLAAIDRVLKNLDDTHAAFKAQHGSKDSQRY